MSCNCCISPDQIASLVKAALYSEISAGNLQAPLLACDGSKLGAAKVPTCDAMTLAISDAVQRMQPIIHDSTLSGYGTCQSPLTVNSSWLTAFVQNLADTIQLIHLGTGGGIAGTGTEADPLTLDIQNDGSLSGLGTTASPLALNVQHDGSLDGNGSEKNPLSVDGKWLDSEIKDYVDANGIHTADGSGISGDGSVGDPLALDINHDDSLDGDGTKAAPLKVDTGWLDDQIAKDISDGDVLKPDSTYKAADEATTDSVSTVIIGGQDATMGRPDAYIKVGSFVVPAYTGVTA